MTRQEARQLNSNTYYTGRPCLRGHTGLRRTSRGDCLVCVKAGQADWVKNNPDKVKAKRKRWYDKSTESLIRWRENNKERTATRQRELMAESPRRMFTTNLSRALKRCPTLCALTVDDLMELWRQQEGKCALSGVVMTWGGQGHNTGVSATSMTMDRFDSRHGYSKNNVRLVCHAINAFRGRMTDNEMYEMAKALLNARPSP